MNSDVMSSFMKNIDWEEMEIALMLRQDPQTRAARKKVFHSLDGSGGGSLDAVELKTGVVKMLTKKNGSSLVPMGDELMPAVKAAFNAAKNLEKSTKRKKVSRGKKAKVGVSEFRAFLIAFKQYLQLVELFEFLDGQGEDNQKLSLREAKRGIFVLNGWGITEEELDEKFAGVEPWVSYLSFKDFAEWCMVESGALSNLELDDSDHESVMTAVAVDKVQKTHGVEMRSAGAGVVPRDSEENQEVAMQLFAKWDDDKSGHISEKELSAVLQALDPKMTTEHVSKLFAAADANKDGNLDYNEFLRWLLS